MEDVVDVVAALIWQDNKFMICQRPENKTRPLMWEFVVGESFLSVSRSRAFTGTRSTMFRTLSAIC